MALRDNFSLTGFECYTVGVVDLTSGSLFISWSECLQSFSQRKSKSLDDSMCGGECKLHEGLLVGAADRASEYLARISELASVAGSTNICKAGRQNIFINPAERANDVIFGIPTSGLSEGPGSNGFLFTGIGSRQMTDLSLVWSYLVLLHSCPQ
eukprot:scaffold249346_cov18-Tisochrysis_lutea.AAC.1